MKKILALVLTLMLVAGIASAFAAGDGMITISNAEIGKEYTLYKLFDATVGSKGETAYMLPTGKTVTNDTFFNTYFKIKNGYIIPEDTFTEDVLKTDAFKTWAKGFGTKIGQTVTATGDEVKWENLDYGYYFIDTDHGPAVTVDSANRSADVIDKNGTIDFDKNIIIQAASEGKEEILDKYNEAGMDITVPFVIDVTAKNYEGTKKVFQYRIKDTVDPGFTFTSDPVVKVGDATLTAGTDYTITYYTDDTATTVASNKANAQYFEIIIPWTDNGAFDGKFLYSNNAKIRVTYDAILDHNKAADIKVGKDANLNNADLDYWYDNDTPDKPSGHKPRRTTKTWETWLKIIKTDEKGKELIGAQFTLSTTNGTKVSYVWKQEYVEDANGDHWKLNDGSYTTEAPNGNATHDAAYASTTKKYKLVTSAEVVQGTGTNSEMAVYVGDDGTILYSGLGTGDYKLEETVVPDGFNKADDLEFTIDFAVDKTTDPENPDGKFSVSGKDASKISLETTNRMFKTTIVNNTGVELPSTGGIGTTLFYIGGSILVLLAVIFLVTKRRMSSED